HRQAQPARRSRGAVSVDAAWPGHAVAQADLCPPCAARRRKHDRRLGLLPGDADLDEERDRDGMAKRPAGLIYGVEDRPAWPVLCLLALQHIMLISSTLVLPIVL